MLFSCSGSSALGHLSALRLAARRLGSSPVTVKEKVPGKGEGEFRLPDRWSDSMVVLVCTITAVLSAVYTAESLVV